MNLRKVFEPMNARFADVLPNFCCRFYRFFFLFLHTFSTDVLIFACYFIRLHTPGQMLEIQSLIHVLSVTGESFKNWKLLFFCLLGDIIQHFHLFISGSSTVVFWMKKPSHYWREEKQGRKRKDIQKDKVKRDVVLALSHLHRILRCQKDKTNSKNVICMYCFCDLFFNLGIRLKKKKERNGIKATKHTKIKRYLMWDLVRSIIFTDLQK